MTPQEKAGLVIESCFFLAPGGEAVPPHCAGEMHTLQFSSTILRLLLHPPHVMRAM